MVRIDQVFVDLVYIPPTFEKGAVVFLKEDVDYKPNSEWPNATDPYFKKGCFFVVVDCGGSIYDTNEKGESTNPIDDAEWCSVEVLLKDPPDEMEVALYAYSGLLKAEDLREIREEDLDETVIED